MSRRSFFLAARFLLVGVALASLGRVHARPPLPLQDGEHLTYRVAWAIVPGAGEIKIDARVEPTAETRLKVTTTTATRRLARVLMPFNASAESIYSLETGRLLSLHEISSKRGERSEHTVAFDYDEREAIYRVPNDAQPPRIIPMPDGMPSDLIMALLQTRTWDLEVGQKRDALVLFDDDFYELTIHAIGYEEVRTSLGKFRTLVLQPRMEKTEPKGMFRKGGSVRVWIAQDAHRLPVKFEVDFPIGTGRATLDAYVPPAETAAPSR